MVPTRRVTRAKPLLISLSICFAVLVVLIAGVFPIIDATISVKSAPPMPIQVPPDINPNVGHLITTNIPGGFWYTIAAVLAIAVVGALLIGFKRYRLASEELRTSSEIKAKEAAALDSAVDRLKDQMSLPSLINLNRIVLDNYHGIATDQAQSSFISSRRAMWCGFAWLLLCFGAAAFLPTAQNSQILIGSLAFTGGALSGFLGRTYIHVYERSLSQLNRYFDQPLLNSYLLSAERVIGEMRSNKDEAYLAVLDRLLDNTGGDAIPESKMGLRRSSRAIRQRVRRSSQPFPVPASNTGTGPDNGRANNLESIPHK